MAATPAVGQHSLREQNLAVVARAVFEATDPPSRADVAAATGLARATVSALVDRLVAGGIVAELPPVAARRAGRPAVPLTPAERTVVGVGLEVAVDRLEAVAVDLTGTVVAQVAVRGDHHDSDPAAVLALLADLAGDLVTTLPTPEGRPLRIAGARLALPGLVEPRTSTLRVAPNLGWADLSPVDTRLVSERLRGAPVAIGNEANLAALAQLEHRRPGPDAPRSFLYVSADVGIGSAIVLDGDVFLGGRGWSGELGHVVVDPRGPACQCGSTGCLEQYAGKDALLDAAGLPRGVDVATALSGAPTPAAADALDRAGRALGSALADFVNLIDIHTVLLGGMYAHLAPELAPVILAQLDEHVLSAPWTTFDVRPAPVASGAAPLGGARSVVRSVVEDPAPWLAPPA
jgi:predicted NBD/HSP70 family sugar kinase